jgi:hypothetical protein
MPLNFGEFRSSVAGEIGPAGIALAVPGQSRKADTQG